MSESIENIQSHTVAATILDRFDTFYFVGIGGIGMSALARYFHFCGKRVLGYDKNQTQLTSNLESENIDITFVDQIDQKISELNSGSTLVIYTPAIKELSILDYFIRENFTIVKRAKVLGLITESSECIAVAGTHGKTTTSTLLGHLCYEANLPVSCFLGGVSENFKSNFMFRGNEISVVEADEYDRSFLNLLPDWAVITSIDADHLDIYGDRNTIEKGFRDFARLVDNTEQLFVRKGIDIGKPCKTYAVNEEADFYSDNLQIVGNSLTFDFHYSNTIEKFTWEIPGIHNVENATASIALLLSRGVKIEVLKKGIANFKGIKRRYTKHILDNGKIYIDDYAHHPTELNAVIGSIRTFYPGKKLLVVFQPHLFSRTHDFAADFARSLEKADQLLLLDIYPARESQRDFPGITSQWLSEKIELSNKKVLALEDALGEIFEQDFDILLTVGAGNIDALYEPIVQRLSRI